MPYQMDTELKSYSDYHASIVALKRSVPFASEYELGDTIKAAPFGAAKDTTATELSVVTDTGATRGPTPRPSLRPSLARLHSTTLAFVAARATADAFTAAGLAATLGSTWFGTFGSTANTIPTSVTANWASFAASNLPARVFSDLVSAASSTKRLQGKQAHLSAKSLGSFLGLWRALGNLAGEPVVSVTPKGYVVAEWVKDERNSLAVMLNSNDEVVYSLFDNGVPTEGVIGTNQLNAFVGSMRARHEDPFLWSDA